ncbi:MAG: MoaD/ThiS family protein [Mariprofundaceae bacterium]
MIKILFFGSIASKLGQHEIMLTSESSMTLADVIKKVGCKDFKPLLLAVNEEQQHDLTMLIQDGDEVAIMPPFSGG